MKNLLHSRWFYITIVLAIIGVVFLMMLGVGKKERVELITTTVEIGTVRQLVSVSGIAEAEKTAELAFPTTGIVKDVKVKVGDFVKTGDILIELNKNDLIADYQEAVANLNKAKASKEEILSGPTSYAREVTSETVAQKQEALETIIADEETKVENAYRTLLSSGLTAFSNDVSEDATPPTITGTYTCSSEGEYIIEVYNSNSVSGYSYRLSGLEAGNYQISTNQPLALGNCGLRIQFDDTSYYNNSKWIIEIPNNKSTNYTSNRNAYALAVTQAESAITRAEQDLELAKASAINANAPARTEQINRADADVAQAEARVNRINSLISDRVLVAPFDGTVTELDILPGETVTSVPVVTLLASSEFEVTARIPEIDIGKLLVGQNVEMVFDAKSDYPLTGRIDFISLKATEIDGVSYYEAIIKIDEIPAWIRSGLNADIDIIIEEREDTLRVPKRFVTKERGGYEVLVLRDEKTSTSSVEVVLEGNDGYMAITGVKSGDTLVAP